MTSLVALVLLARVAWDSSRAGVSPIPRPRFWEAIRRGCREACRRSWYLTSVLAHAAGNFALAPCLALGPIVAQQHLGGPSAWGLISAATGAGAVLGGIAVFRYLAPHPLVLGNLAGGLVAFETLAFAVPMPLPVIAGLAGLGALGVVYLNEVWNTVVQSRLPSDILSSLSSFDLALSFSVFPLGLAATGALAERWGPTPVFVVGGCLGLVAAAIGGSAASVRRVRLPVGDAVPQP